MSGGGSSKKKTTKSKDEPAAPVASPVVTQPAFMGDNQNLIAQQLAAGGYGSVPDLMAMLTQMHSPMQFTPPTGPSPTGSSGGSSGSGDDEQDWVKRLRSPEHMVGWLNDGFR